MGVDRSGKTCEKCGPAKNHGPTIGVAVVLGLVVVGVIVLNRSLLKATAVFKFLKQMRSTGKVKFRILFFALQVRRSGASHVDGRPLYSGSV